MKRNLIWVLVILILFTACENPTEVVIPVYSITYDVNGDQVDGLAPVVDSKYKKGESHKILDNSGFSLSGFSFIEWNTKADGDGTSYQAGDSLVVDSSDVVLYALWQINQYTLSFDLQAGVAGADGAVAQTADYQSSVSIADAPSMTGYTFVEWNTNAAGNGDSYNPGDSYQFTSPEGQTLYAIWKINQYTISYDLEGGTAGPGGAAAETADYGASVSVADAPSMTGYTFVEWNTDADANGETYASGASLTLGAGNVVLHAIWTINQYSLQFDLQGGTAGADGAATQTADYQTSVPVAQTPSRSGYTFVEWNTDANGNGIAYTPGDSYELAAAVNAVLFAIWIPNHTVGTVVDMKNTVVQIINEDGDVLSGTITLVPGQDCVLSVAGSFVSYRWYINGSRYSDKTVTFAPNPGVSGITVVVTDADGDVFSASLIVNAYNAVSQ